MIMPGQCLRMPSCTCANSAGSLDELSSGLRTWMCTSVAPASNAACVLSTCSEGVTGRAGLSFLRGTDPVMAQAMTTGSMAANSLDVEEHGLLRTVQVDVEHVDCGALALLAPGQQRFAP